MRVPVKGHSQFSFFWQFFVPFCSHVPDMPMAVFKLEFAAALWLACKELRSGRAGII
jgi:hypothetical protein